MPRLVESLSRALARLLAGSWRTTTPPAEIDEDVLTLLTPLLIGSGASALSWRRVRHLPLRATPAALGLQRAFLHQALDCELREQRIVEVLEQLQAHGIEPLLIKGWATARLYPEPGLRPFGDIDLLIRPVHKDVAANVLNVEVDSAAGHELDVKTLVPKLYALNIDDLFASSQRVRVRETSVSLLGAEDQLRVLCLHFLKHGAYRPLWLCDVAAALEFRPAAFDWNRCLGWEPKRADWIACVLGLAHQLLEARVDDTPVAERARRLPPWLVPAVLKAWETPQISEHQANPLIMDAFSRGGGLEAVCQRWPNPVEAAVRRHAPLSRPPWMSQSACFLANSLDFLGRLPGLLGQAMTGE